MASGAKPCVAELKSLHGSSGPPEVPAWKVFYLLYSSVERIARSSPDPQDLDDLFEHEHRAGQVDQYYSIRSTSMSMKM